MPLKVTIISACAAILVAATAAYGAVTVALYSFASADDVNAFQKVTMSARTPRRSCAPQGANRKPVTVSSRYSNAPYRSARSRSAVKSGSEETGELPADARGAGPMTAEVATAKARTAATAVGGFRLAIDRALRAMYWGLDRFQRSRTLRRFPR